MKTLVIIPSIRILKYWHTYEWNAKKNNFNLNNIEVIVIDETDKNRKINDEILKNVTHYFYGEYEREKWFNDLGLKEYTNIIPKNSHAETSFGLLWAYYEDRFDNIIFIDDDTATTEHNYFNGHVNQLRKHNIESIECNNYWYNLLPEFYTSSNLYPRGFPYSERKDHILKKNSNNNNIDIVMNQGMWLGQLDLNACDILPYCDGLTRDEKIIYNSKNLVIDKNIYTTICSMNLSFKPEIIPAFAQIDEYRFDDIWSGIIIKKIADHLNKGISHGSPFCKHLKEPRSTFKDIIIESKRLELNEYFWKYVDDTELNGRNWSECYYEIAKHLYKINDLFSTTKEYIPIKNYSIKMMEWLDCLDELDKIK